MFCGVSLFRPLLLGVDKVMLGLRMLIVITLRVLSVVILSRVILTISMLFEFSYTGEHNIKRREPKGCLGRVFNFKLDSFTP